MKGFPMDKTDKRALDIASRINTFLEQGGNVSDTLDMLPKLEGYVPMSRSDAFVWELVYIQRFVLTYLKNHASADELTQCAQTYANLYDAICRLNPTANNCTFRVNGYVHAAEHFEHVMQKRKARRLRVHAKELFEELEKSDSKIYHTAGMYLYYAIFEFNFTPQNSTTPRFNAIKKAVEHTRALYQIEQTEQYLRFLASMFKSYSSFSQFSFDDEEENFRTLVEWLDNSPFSSDKISRLRWDLKISFHEFKLKQMN